MHKVHLEAARGSADNNVKYCSKQWAVKTHVEHIQPSQRTDIQGVSKIVKKGASLKRSCRTISHSVHRPP